MTNDPDTAVRFNGSTGRVTSNSSAVNPQSFTVEAWFRTTTTSGGRLIGFGNSQTGTSSNYDRHLYMTNNGRLIFGVWAGQREDRDDLRQLQRRQLAQGRRHLRPRSRGPLRRRRAHRHQHDHLLRPDLRRLLARRERQPERLAAAPTSNAFNGTIDEVAVYSTILPATSVADHVNAR